MPRRAAPNAEQGLPSMLESSLAKCFANQMVREVCGHGVQLMGAYGYSGSIRWSSACGMDGLCIPGGASISRRRTSPRPWSGVASINAVENTVPHCPGPLERLLDIPGFLESGREGRHGF
nr:acyl-CoA dehydrogenase family protein [Solimonas sp. SE-A11]